MIFLKEDRVVINYYNEIKDQLLNNEIYERIKDYSIERHRVNTYFNIGKLLYEAGKEYGENIIGQYSKRLMKEVGKKYNYRTLYRMRKFYKVFSTEKLTPLVSKLTWSHYLQLLSIKDENEIIYYINICLSYNLSKRDLINKIKNNEYERLDDKSKSKLKYVEELKAYDLVKNPIIINNKNKYEIISEKILKQLIMEDIECFMQELGNQFCFVKSEYKIKIGTTYNYIDLLLYNIEFNCYVVIELKVTDLKKEHIGQIQVYMNYIDGNLKKANQEKTIGIIICKKNNRYIIEYCSDSRIISKEYKIV